MTAKHILLTTDLSEESMRAFEPVFQLARDLRARVTLLHVVHEQIRAVAPVAAGMPMLAVEPEQAARTAQRNLARMVEEAGPEVEVTTEACVGHDVIATVLDFADKHDVDFIAMATHGHSGIKRLLLGSTAESVVRQSRVPVILYPA